VPKKTPMIKRRCDDRDDRLRIISPLLIHFGMHGDSEIERHLGES
jgi:hypothetical protein